ncbi:MAG: peptidoglycan endopeptidase [Pseudomonadota bacterium]
MTNPEALAKAATSFIGVRFRLHGRDPAFGLDCVGLLHASLRAIDCNTVTPRGYRLRNGSMEQWRGLAERNGLLEVECDIAPGDVLLTAPGPHQQHILIVEDAGKSGSFGSVIHAHAGLRRVVRQAIIDPPELLAHWRLHPNDRET